VQDGLFVQSPSKARGAKERAKAKRERWIQRLIDRLQRGEN
jgi:hypothetical protein